MPLILPVNNTLPEIPKDCYIAPNATIVGDVVMGNQCSVWFNTVIRGDVNYIRIGNKVNIQDNVCIHCTYQKNSTTIGNNVSIGHNATIHGCIINDHVLVGMGSIIMDSAEVSSFSIIAAGAVVLENTICEPYSIYAGMPAKKVKKIPENKIQGEIERIANNYILYSSWYRFVDSKKKIK